MKFGIAFANTGAFAEPAQAVEMTKAAEEVGFESIWTVEHIIVPKDYESPYPYSRSGRMAPVDDFDLPDPFVWLAYLAAVTSTIRLGTGVVILPLRNPLILAKTAATLDRFSNGRLIVGIGAGWLEEEFDALGIPFADRGRRADDYLQALEVLWRDDLASYDGEFTSFEDVYLRPLPVQRPIPLVIGGHSKAAARRAGRFANGLYPARGTVEQLAELQDVARRAAEEADRDPDALEFTVGCRPSVDSVGERIDQGFDRVALGVGSVDDVRRIGDEIISKFV